MSRISVPLTSIVSSFNTSTMKLNKLNPLLLAAAVLAGHAHAATIVDPTLVSGPGNVIDPPGSETVDVSFGTAQATLEARSDLRVLQDFTGFAASASGNNIVSFTSTLLPDIQFQFSGSFSTTQAGAGTTLTSNSTSGSSYLNQRNSATGTSTLTISFGTWDGSAFTTDQTVGAAGFTLTNVYTGKNGTVIFRDALGNALNTGLNAISYTGLNDVDGTGNHRDFYIGWDSDAQSTAAIGSISITFTGTAFNSGLDDFAFTTIPEPASALLGGLGMLVLLRRRRSA